MRNLIVYACMSGVVACTGIGFDLFQGNDLKKAFTQNANKYDLPVELMLAVAYHESRMTYTPSYVTYETGHIGTKLAETAFGISADRLGQASTDDVSTFSSQIKAYAEFVRSELDAKDIYLTQEFVSMEQKIAWLWEIAKLHRSGNIYDTNLRSLYVLELINILNKGFTWQDPVSGEVITLQPQDPKIERRYMTYPQQRLLNLKTSASQTYQAQWLYPVEPPNEQEKTNKPQRILVVHCPFSLSTCLELQNTSLEEEDDEVLKLQAHYIIPADEGVVDYPVQVMHHQKQAQLLADNGTIENHTDKIVVMLSGNSGRVNGNVRFPVDPTWQSTFQLEWFGHLIKELCLQHLSLPEDEIKDCRDITSPNTRVTFSLSTEKDGTYTWGKIPDFDRSIYSAYSRSIEKIKATLVYPDITKNKKYQRKIFKSGDNVRIVLSNVGRHSYVLEKLIRCSNNQQLEWVTVSQSESSGRQEFNLKFFDGGVNNNGVQFLRVKVYNKDKLTSWTVDSVSISDYKKEENTSSHYKECKAS